jgi:hypothetical protein
MLCLVLDGWDNLRGRAAVADEGDILVRQVNIVSPFGSVEHGAFEAFNVWEIWHARIYQDARTAEEKLALVDMDNVRCGIPDRDTPATRLLDPFASLDTGIEAHLLAEAILSRHTIEILPDFLVGWQDLGPLGVWSKGEAVEQAGNIARTSWLNGTNNWRQHIYSWSIHVQGEHTWILVGKPCASQIATLFEEANVGDSIPPLDSASQSYARESSANTGKLAVCDLFCHVNL